MKILFLACIFFPIYLVADMREEYIELFGKNLCELKLDESEKLLQNWERNFPEDETLIKSLRATLFLASGDLVTSSKMMEESLHDRIGGLISSQTVNTGLLTTQSGFAPIIKAFLE